MVEVRFEEIAKLRGYLERFSGQNGRVLFRGQCRHYTGSDGRVSMVSSFGRQGCIPPLMRKWTHYGFDILQTLSPADSHDSLKEDSAALVQALLQHYGWRSFFLDLTASPAVASWFASHRHSSKTMLDASEDCHESDVLLFRQRSTYAPSSAEGYVYLLSVDAIERHGLRCIDLAGSITSNFRSRFSVQRAWLAGPSKNAFPADCVIARIAAPCELLAEMAAADGLSSADDLFPSRIDDVFLKLLLSVPWDALDENGGQQVFRRALLLPEYDYRFEKTRPASDAFVTPFWLSEDAGFCEDARCSTWLQVSEIALYANQPEEPFAFPVLNSLLTNGGVGVEVDAIMRLAERHESSSYRKGLVIERRSADVVQVMSLTVDHPGCLVEGAGVEEGWFYRIDGDGIWHRFEHSEQCSCNNPRRHEQLFWALHAIERGLGANHVEQVGDGLWRDRDLVRR